MQSLHEIRLPQVQAVYSGPEGRLWELLMGEQIHIGGLQSSLDLAERAGISAGWRGVDFCCCTGAGMRFLLRFRNVAHMTGVDATPTVLALARQRAQAEGVADCITFVEANVCATGLAGGSFDFVWGEDAWCYVEDKPALMVEAARLLKTGGTLAFTDWMEGPTPMTPEEARPWALTPRFVPCARCYRRFKAMSISLGPICSRAAPARFATISPPSPSDSNVWDTRSSGGKCRAAARRIRTSSVVNCRADSADRRSRWIACARNFNGSPSGWANSPVAN